MFDYFSPIFSSFPLFAFVQIRARFIRGLTCQSGPEMPPSLRILQKCTAINIMAIRGIPIQCHTYALSKAFPPTREPPNSASRMPSSACQKHVYDERGAVGTRGRRPDA